MNALDWVLIALFAIGALYGLRAGLVQSALNLAAILVALALSSRFASGLVGNFTDNIENEALTTAIGYIAIFIAVYVIAQIIGKAIRGLLKIVFLGWVDKLGGLAVGMLFGVALGLALLTAGARYAYVFDDSEASGSLPQRFIEARLNEVGRDKVDGWLVESKYAPVLLDVRDAVPGDMFGLISGDFTTALDILDVRVNEFEAQEGL